MGRHVRPVAAIDDQRLLGAEAPGGARGVHRGVAAAIDHDAAAEQRRLAGLDVAQQRHRVEHLDRVARRDVDVLGEMGADRDEDGVEAARPPCSASTSSTLWLRTIADAHRLDPPDLLHQIRARQAIGGDAEMQHAAGQRAGLVDLDLWPSRVR